MTKRSLAWWAIVWSVSVLPLSAGELSRPGQVESPAAAIPGTPADRGFHWLTTKPYLPADFDNATLESLWQNWSSPRREQAEKATPAERRRLTFEYYGLMPRPGSTTAGAPLGYVDDGRNGFVMNCLSCHTGKVAGEVVLGVGNSQFALQTLTEDVRWTKIRMGKPLSHLDLASLKMPLGTSHGTTNSVIFGVALGSIRDKDLNLVLNRPEPQLLHHDMDAPPLWNVRKKKMLYSDGFVAKGHRPLLQFVMLPRNSGKQLKGWEPDFRDILAWIESLPVPKYRGEIDRPLADRGKVAFEAHCARCHGTYGTNGTYPNKVVSIDEVQTDPLRLKSLTTEYRKSMQDGWFGDYGAKPYNLDPQGYLAPPLDGIWASAPYLHNGSVPTLWHVLHPDSRPAVWKRTVDGYDRARGGLEVEEFSAVPPTAKSPAEKRSYFDTRLPGKSAAGHRFPDELSEEQKRAVLEYLKTL